MLVLYRRDFLKIGAAAGAVAACPSLLNAMELKLGGKDFHQIRTYHPREKKTFVCTSCPYFDGGYTYSENNQILKVEGNPDHIGTRGKFCAKGLASFFSASDPDRILAPMKRVGPRGSGEWQEISWNEAISEVAERVKASMDQPDSIFLNEGGFKDGATVRFMDTIGSNSVFRSRVPAIGCHARQSALKQMTGHSFLLPDLENSKYILNFGANILETAFPLAQRLTDGVVNRKLKIITFDVRMSNTAGRSDEWYPIFPGSDGIIALAMANVIMQEGLADIKFIDAWTKYSSTLNTWTDFSSDGLTEDLKQYTPEMAAKASGIAADTIREIAREFAKTKPAAVFSMNGVTRHQNPTQAEAACTLLAVITGNIDTEGGNCLPRQYHIAAPQPAPQPVGDVASRNRYNHLLPFELKDGKRRVKVLFNHMSNPAYSAPASSLWREVLSDEHLVPYMVDFSPFMSETAEFADIILPDVVSVERYDVASAPTSLLPWVSMTVPQFKGRGQSKDVRLTLKSIVETIDADGSLGMKKYWAFASPRKWVEQELKATPKLEKSYRKVKRGAFPKYGKIDSNTRKIVNRGKAVKFDYGTYNRTGFATPSGKIEIATPFWNANPRHAAMQPGEFILTSFKVAFHSRSMTANLKYLSELWHSNPLWVNSDVAKELKISDGSLVRVSSEVGHMVTKAWLTQGIHPQVVGLSTSVGHKSYGRIAIADRDAQLPFAQESQYDPDIENLWWKDSGVNPNDIIPISIDPESGIQAWNDIVVTVTPAQPGDKYGDIVADNAKHLAIYKKSLGRT